MLFYRLILVIQTHTHLIILIYMDFRFLIFKLTILFNLSISSLPCQKCLHFFLSILTSFHLSFLSLYTFSTHIYIPNTSFSIPSPPSPFFPLPSFSLSSFLFSPLFSSTSSLPLLLTPHPSSHSNSFLLPICHNLPTHAPKSLFALHTLYIIFSFFSPNIYSPLSLPSICISRSFAICSPSILSLNSLALSLFSLLYIIY